MVKKTTLILAVLFLWFVQPICATGINGLLCYSAHKNGQPVNAKHVTMDVTENMSSYSGVYTFGFGESRSYLVVIVAKDTILFQHRRKTPGNSGTWGFHNISGVRMNKNKLLSKGWSGEFVIYSFQEEDRIFQNNLVSKGYQGGVYKGLIVYYSTLGINNELAIKTKDDLADYPITFTRRLVESDLRDKSKKELTIMRNEIFAGYGYIFNPKGKMDSYFRKQSWYSPQHKDVTGFLTDIEHYNVAFIRSYE